MSTNASHEIALRRRRPSHHGGNAEACPPRLANRVIRGRVDLCIGVDTHHGCAFYGFFDAQAAPVRAGAGALLDFRTDTSGIGDDNINGSAGIFDHDCKRSVAAMGKAKGTKGNVVFDM